MSHWRRRQTHPEWAKVEAFLRTRTLRTKALLVGSGVSVHTMERLLSRETIQPYYTTQCKIIAYLKSVRARLPE
jgi:hypothetical protein